LQAFRENGDASECVFDCRNEHAEERTLLMMFAFFIISLLENTTIVCTMTCERHIQSKPCRPLLLGKPQ
jgi:hypothetical protein